MPPHRNLNPRPGPRPRPAMSSRPQSFHGPTADRRAPIPRWSRSHPNLLRMLPPQSKDGGGVQRLTKLLLNVAFQSSLGPVRVVMSPEKTVADLVGAAVGAYAKEGRRPLLPCTDPEAFELHYSQNSLESLEPAEKLGDLGSRNFVLLSKRTKMTVVPSP